MATTKIKDPIEGIIDLDRLPSVRAAQVRRVIDSVELQRLRGIHQLGFSERVYPGATHTRFAHSLGCFQGAQRTMRQLMAAGAEIPDDWFVATALACLLHDLGHGPFSHAFEAVAGRKHEAWTQQMVEHGPQIPQRLEELREGTGQKVLQLLRGEVEIPALRWLADLVSSALDCDRMDYLRRDSLHTGTRYGSFDRDWLIRGMVPSYDGHAILIAPKGTSAVEQYLIGRYHMFQNVYLHKTSRGFETAFRGLCHRLRELGPEAGRGQYRAIGILYEENFGLDRYLSLRDAHFLVDFDLLVDHEDATVRALAEALHHRRPLRALTVFGEESGRVEELLAERREQARRRGLDPTTAAWMDRAEDVPYRPYAPQEGRKGLRVRLGEGEAEDITRRSPTLKALAAPVVVQRLYWIGEEQD